MNTLDPHRLFQVFNQDPREVVETPEEDFTFNQLSFIISEVKSFYVTDKIYTNRKNKKYSSVRNIIRHKLFLSLVCEIESLDLEQVQKLKNDGGLEVIDDILQIFELLLKYFENIEQYEKCAIILPIIDIIKSS